MFFALGFHGIGRFKSRNSFIGKYLFIFTFVFLFQVVLNKAAAQENTVRVKVLKNISRYSESEIIQYGNRIIDRGVSIANMDLKKQIKISGDLFISVNEIRNVQTGNSQILLKLESGADSSSSITMAINSLDDDRAILTDIFLKWFTSPFTRPFVQVNFKDLHKKPDLNVFLKTLDDTGKIVFYRNNLRLFFNSQEPVTAINKKPLFTFEKDPNSSEMVLALGPYDKDTLFSDILLAIFQMPAGYKKFVQNNPILMLNLSNDKEDCGEPGNGYSGLISGTYHLREKKISLCLEDYYQTKGVSYSLSKEKTVVHEFGHHIGLNLPQDVQDMFYQIDWERNWLNQWIYKGSNNLNLAENIDQDDYARTNEREDFAVAFTAYTYTPRLLKKNFPKKYFYFQVLETCINSNIIGQCMSSWLENVDSSSPQ